MAIRHLISVGIIGMVGLTACADNAQTQTEQPSASVSEKATTEQVEAAVIDSIAAAISHPSRPAEDVINDEERLPEATLRFAGLEPGMTVLELEAGSGYYTEIMSRVVGEDGQVYLQNPPSFDGFLGDKVDVRLAENRLPNVIHMKTDFDELTVDDQSIDMVTWIQGPHELWFESNGKDSFGSPEGSFAEIARVLKPGGTFLVIDHAAVDTAGPEVGHELHRANEKIIHEMATNAGLTIDRSSDILKNPDDPLTNSVFDPSIRGKTNQFVLTYTK